MRQWRWKAVLAGLVLAGMPHLAMAAGNALTLDAIYQHGRQMKHSDSDAGGPQ